MKNFLEEISGDVHILLIFYQPELVQFRMPEVVIYLYIIFIPEYHDKTNSENSDSDSGKI